MQKGVRKTLAMTFVFLMILPAILTPQVGATEAQQPSLSVGNYWKYRVEYLNPDSGNVIMSGTTTREIIREANITIGSETYQCLVIQVEGSWADTTIWTMSGAVYRLKSDLRTVKEDMEITMRIGEEVIYNQISNVTYDPPLLKELSFPLTEGKNWTVSVNKTETVTLSGEPPDTKTTYVARNYTVGMAIDRVTVDAGTFDTFVISYTSDYIYEQYYSPSVGGNVMELQYRRIDERLLMRMELMETNYVAPSGPLEWWLWLSIAIIIVVAVSIVYIFIIRMRKPSTPSGTAKMTLAANFLSPSIF